MKIEQLHQHFLSSSGICTDTRKITRGCLFFALKGDNFDGNKFTQEALDKGAFKVVIDNLNYHKNTGETILTANVLQLLQKLAAYHRKQLNIPIIGLTGSNGKTTTKELIHAVLKQKFNTTATIGNLNNHIGVPLTLLSMTSETEIGIVEMGANHLKEIAQLCKLANPDYGYVTNFGKAHLEGFGSIEGVIQGKSELYKHIKEHDKKVFVNANDPKQIELTESLNCITFGNEEQQFYIQLKEATDNLVLQFDGLEIKSQLIGIYNFHNIATAIAMGSYFGVPSDRIKEAIEGYIPEMNRSQIVVKNGHRIILDAYNANPTSMMAALENFQHMKGTNKLMILGDMFELGDESEKEHQHITTFLENNPFGKVCVVGSHFFKTKATSKHIKQFKTFNDLENNLKKNLSPQSYILIKGSRGMALERVLELL
ncbi:MAG: UDP-N-acetylmuramoyl-tripeptide--D-alanyl-D-alanine ligase [Flavobacteriaceae bacterium]|nr:UDP-N-acetylmuramoyl-tripeptide--D-alanyl-D-alanine ligase [Flavobacteriaceae bacterium]